MGQWFIIQVNPNCETKAVGEIRRAGFRAYMPTFARIRRHHRTKEQIVVHRPLLVGYVFMRFPEQPNWYALRQCQGVKGVLYSDGKPFSLPQTAVAAIMREQRKMAHDTDDARALRSGKLRGEKHALARAKFKSGMRVAATSGPLERIIATVKRVTDRGTIEAVADIMGSETPIEYSETDGLEVLDNDLRAA